MGGGSGPTSVVETDLGVSHVHGLGLTPGDATLYVATHHGTFRIGPDREAERVGDSYQDTMGFTVAGADRFLGSGHPDAEGFRRGEPPRLGLIESTDGGATWKSLSLSGEADFHGLAFSHGQVYGWDASSGRFMVSADSRTWETRAALPLTGFAVDPADAGHIVAAGPDNLMESRDGGRSWVQKPGPALMVLSWDGRAGLVGVTKTGAVHRSMDGGATWASAGQLPGTTQAVLVSADAWYAAVADPAGATVIYRSGDGGRRWEAYYEAGA